MKRNNYFNFVLLVFLLFAAILPFGCSGSSGADDVTSYNYEAPPQPSYPTYYVGNDYDLRLVYEYNATDGRVRKWDKPYPYVIYVYDGIGIPNLQAHLNDWSQYIPPHYLLLTASETAADIKIRSDVNFHTNTGYCGMAYNYYYNYKTVSSDIVIDTSNSYWCNGVNGYRELTAKHEIGHAIGFYKHLYTSINVMGNISFTVNPDGTTTINPESFAIVSDIQRTLLKLYSLPPGSYIVP